MKVYRIIGWIFNKPIIEERRIKMKKKATKKKAVKKTKAKSKK